MRQWAIVMMCAIAELCILEFMVSAGPAQASYRGFFGGWAPASAATVLLGALALQIVASTRGSLRRRRWVGLVGLICGAGALAFAVVGDYGRRRVEARWLSDRRVPMPQLATFETELGWLAAVLLIASAVLMSVRSRWAVPAAFLPGCVVVFIAALNSWAQMDSTHPLHPGRPLRLWTADNIGWAAAVTAALAAWWWASLSSRPLPGLMIAVTALLVAWSLASGLPGADALSFDAPVFGIFFQAAMGLALLGCIIWCRPHRRAVEGPSQDPLRS